MPEANYKMLNKDANGNLIINNGNVGIGTTAPGAELDVKGTIYVNHGTDAREYGLQLYRDGIIGPAYSTLILNSRANHSYEGIDFQINGSSKMFLDMNGNVGIGTTTPTASLETPGTIIAKDSRLGSMVHPGYAGFSHKNMSGAGDYCLIQNGTNGHVLLNAPTGQYIGFRINNHEKMRLTSDGNLGIASGNTAYPLTVGAYSQPNTTLQLLRYFGGTGIEERWVGNTTETLDRPLSAYFTAGLWIAQEHNSGIPYGYRRGVIYSSDERIKKDITLVDDDLALQKVNALESKQYNYKGDLYEQEHKTIGFIAQDVLKVLPEAVSFEKSMIPDELREIKNPIWDNNILTIPDLDMTADNFTGKCKFIVTNDISGTDVETIIIECERDISGNKTNQFRFTEEYTNIFLYGKEVNDFHTIEKNLIFALHHSAIQELSRRNDAKTEKINILETKNIELQKTIDNINQKNNSLTTELENIKADMVIIKQKLGIS